MLKVTDPVSPAPVHRIQENFLAASERQLLNAICARLPAWVKPDLLTAIGIAGSAIVFAGYAASTFHAGWLWLAIFGFAVQWFGDSLDGSLARYRRIERPSFGYFIDHSCDGIATLLIAAGLGFSPYVRLDVALFALCGYLLMAVHTFLAARVVAEVRLSYLNFGPTELRFVMIGMTIAMMILGPEPDRFAPYSGFDALTLLVGVFLVGLFSAQTLITGRRLDRIDRGVGG